MGMPKYKKDQTGFILKAESRGESRGDNQHQYRVTVPKVLVDRMLCSYTLRHGDNNIEWAFSGRLVIESDLSLKMHLLMDHNEIPKMPDRELEIIANE